MRRYRNMKKWIQLGVAIALTAVFVVPGFSQSRRPNERSVSELQKRLKDSKTAQSAANMVKSQLEGQGTDDLVRQAQERLKALKRGNSPDTPSSPPAAKPVTVARPAPVAPAPASPAPMRAAPVPATPVAATTPVPRPAPSVASNTVPVPAASAAPAPSIAANPNVPPPRPLKPRYDREEKDKETMEITAEESVMDSANHLVTFDGDVLVTHPGFTLRGEKLVIYLHEDENQPGEAPSEADEDRPPFKRAIATGPMVEIERIGAEGKIQIAKARQADYNALTGDIELSGGPPTLQNGDSLIEPEGDNAKIFLTQDGRHRIQGKATTIFEMKGKKGKSSGNIGPGFGPGGLDSITNRNKR